MVFDVLKFDPKLKLSFEFIILTVITGSPLERQMNVINLKEQMVLPALAVSVDRSDFDLF